MQAIIFSAEIRPLWVSSGIQEMHIMERLRGLAEDAKGKTGADVNITMSEAHQTFRAGQKYYQSMGGQGYEIPACKTYTISGICNPNNVPSIEKWKMAVLSIVENYRQLVERQTDIQETVEVLFNSKDGPEVYELKDEKSFEEATKDIKQSISRQEIEELFK